MSKDFDGWNNVKKSIDALVRAPLYKEGEIWWCSIGVNIGHEILGKGDRFTRPVLVIKKFSHYTFLGASLTTADNNINKNMFPYNFDGKNGYIRLDQIRTYDSRRFGRRMHKMSEDDFNAVKQSIIDML